MGLAEKEDRILLFRRNFLLCDGKMLIWKKLQQKKVKKK